VLGSITFRVIHDSDKEFLIRLFADSRAWELQHTIWTEQARDDFIKRQFALQDADYKKTFIGAIHRIIQLDGEDIGRLIVNRRDDLMHIIDISIATAFQGRGIGSDILKSLINEAHGGKVPVELSVESGNPAINLYQSLGFKQQRVAGNHIYMKWTPNLGPREI